MVLNAGRRPRILLIVDIPDWAFHTLARAIQAHLSHKYEFETMIGREIEHFDDAAYDLIHVFFEFEEHHLPFLRGNSRVLKSVYSHYWQERGMNAREFHARHLREAHAVSVPSLRLLSALQDLPVPVFLCPEGLDTSFFTPAYHPSRGPLVVGWAGNPERPIKRLDWLRGACEGVCELRTTDGLRSPHGMLNFYREIDVIACSSRAEGAPRPLLEGMACGNFPLSFDVGIAGELITDGLNGMLVRDESVAGLRAALQWCAANADEVRRKSEVNAELMRARRDWSCTIPAQERVYDALLAQRQA